jgi:hypothetical protein
MPPLTGVAVNVTLVPEQIVPIGLAVIDTLTGNIGFTAIVMVFEVAGLPVEQAKEDVIMQ